jgi:hypothetical protein
VIVENQAPQHSKRRRFWNWGVLGLLVLAVVLGLRFLPIGEHLERFTAWIERMGPTGYLFSLFSM